MLSRLLLVLSVPVLLGLTAQSAQSPAQSPTQSPTQSRTQPPSPARTLALAPLFGDHMVLPAQAEIVLHGTGATQQAVTVTPSWAAATECEVAADGRWQVSIKTPARGQQVSLKVRSGQQNLTIEDVLVGDVWLASGQSNMEMPIGAVGGWQGVDNWQQEVAAAKHAELRVFQAERQMGEQPMHELRGRWQVCSPDVAAEFSATGYFFARDLVKAGKGPIGLVVSSWGGTRCEAWTSATGLQDFAEFAAPLLALQKGSSEELLEQRRQAFFAAAQAAEPMAATEPVTLPGPWSAHGLGDFDGVVDYARTVALPVQFRGKDLRLQFGAIDDMDTVFVHGERVCGSEVDGLWSRPRDYVVPAQHTNVETLELLVRVFDTGGEGGFTGSADDLRLTVAGDPSGAVLSLAGTWQRTVRAEIGKLPMWPARAGGPSRPSVLWNGMIEPLLPFPFTGCIWYQGESNRDQAAQYAKLFPAMIRDWRRVLQRDVPFYFVQIAPYGYGGDTGQTAALRDAQAAALQLPNTGMVVTLDCGDARDIHPQQKQPVGARLALLARRNHYGDDVAANGPQIVGASRNGARVQIRVRGDGSELQLLHAGAGFEVAASDGQFHAAVATIERGQLFVSAAAVAEPVTVRYAYEPVPKWSLVNQHGLPAAPFLLPVR